MDIASRTDDNPDMQKSVEQQVEDYRRASEKLRREIGDDPVKARAFLVSAGILKPLPTDGTDPAGVAEPTTTSGQ